MSKRCRRCEEETRGQRQAFTLEGCQAAKGGVTASLTGDAQNNDDVIIVAGSLRLAKEEDSV